MSPDAWERLRPVLLEQPGHAAGALSDLRAVTERWEAKRRSWLVHRVADRGQTGTPLPAALMLALGEALDE